jgi:hypothetical protein
VGILILGLKNGPHMCATSSNRGSSQEGLSDPRTLEEDETLRTVNLLRVRDTLQFQRPCICPQDCLGTINNG